MRRGWDIAWSHLHRQRGSCSKQWRFDMPDVTSLFFVAALLFIRFFVALRFVPLLGDRSLPLAPCAGIALLLAFFFLPEQLGKVGSSPAVFEIAVGGIKEIAVGALLGVSIRLCWSILFFAGGIVHQFSATSAEVEGTLGWRQLYLFLGGGIFLLMDGHHAVFTAISQSLVGIPIGAEVGHWAVQDGNLMALILVVFSSAFSVGVLVAAPVFVVALTTEFLIGVSQRILAAQAQHQWGILLRLFATQVAVVFFLWQVVFVGVDFLSQNMEKITHSIANQQ